MVNKQSNKIMLILFTLLAVISVIMSKPVAVNASGMGDGQGGRPTNSGWGHWYHADSKNGSTAWEKFSKLHVYPGTNGNYRWRTQSLMHGPADGSKKYTINALGRGWNLKDGKEEALSTTCTNSDYVWWYGAERGHKDYYAKRIYFQGDNTHDSRIGRDAMDGETMRAWEEYLAWPKSNWNAGNVVLVCSGSFFKPAPIPITLAANSKTVTYNGENHTVSGLNRSKSDTSKLKSTHKIDFTATKTEKNVGSYAVKVTKANVVDKKTNKNVSDQYAITTIDGILNINPNATTNPPGDNERCVSDRTTTASAYVLNKTKGSEGFTPTGAPNLNPLYADNLTNAGKYAKDNALPKKGATEASWNTWKSNFEKGSSTTTPELDLVAGGVSSVLSKYGGVYNITKELQKDKYEVTTCQPQERKAKTVTKTRTVKVCTVSPEGKKKCENKKQEYKEKKWGKWENKGRRVIKSSSGPKSTLTYEHYQILSVNYNKPGFDKVKKEVKGRDLSLANGHGGAVLETPKKTGAGPGKLGRAGHETSKDSFYNDGNSIRNALVCTSDSSISGVGVSFDAVYNLGNEPLYTHVKNPEATRGASQEHDLPNDNNELVFFRDNKDRQVRVDLWYPKETGLADVKTSPGSDATATYAKVYGGSPEGEITTISPWKKEGQKINLQDNSDGQVQGERTWKHQTVNRFLVKSQWSSDEGSPYEFGVNWVYKAVGRNIVPAKANGDKVTKMTGEYSYPFDVVCEFKPKLGDYQASSPAIPYVNGTAKKTWDPINAIKILFSRSASDTRN